MRNLNTLKNLRASLVEELDKSKQDNFSGQNDFVSAPDRIEKQIARLDEEISDLELVE